jgi:hypothetical protein
MMVRASGGRPAAPARLEFTPVGVQVFPASLTAIGGALCLAHRLIEMRK